MIVSIMYEEIYNIYRKPDQALDTLIPGRKSASWFNNHILFYDK